MTFLVRFFFFKAIYGCEVHPFQSCKPGENLPGSIPNLRRSHHGDDVVTGHQTSSWLGSPIAGWFHGKSPKWMITRGTPMNGKPPYHNIIYIHIYIYINIRYRLWFIYIYWWFSSHLGCFPCGLWKNEGYQTLIVWCVRKSSAGVRTNNFGAPRWST